MDRDQQLKALFKKILSSFSMGALWMLVMSALAFYAGLAIVHGAVRWYNIVFYAFFVLSLIWLLRFLYKTWKNG